MILYTPFCKHWMLNPGEHPFGVAENSNLQHILNFVHQHSNQITLTGKPLQPKSTKCSYKQFFFSNMYQK